MQENGVADRLLSLEPKIRYVAVNQNGQITEMEQSQSHRSSNPAETDRMEELLVNPVVLELTRRRGDLDLEGLRYVVIRYGSQYQLVMPYRNGHISIGVNLADDPIAIAHSVATALGLRT